jgi:hypothetical protein
MYIESNPLVEFPFSFASLKSQHNIKSIDDNTSEITIDAGPKICCRPSQVW